MEELGSAIVAFLPVALLLVITPGPDNLIVIRNTAHGRCAGLATASGVLGGLLVHSSAAAVGLAALVAASAAAFTVIKVVGAAYLVLLGIQSLWGSRPSADEAKAPESEPTPVESPSRPAMDRRRGRGDHPLTWQRALRQGFLTNLLNPKIAVFFVAMLPQFVPAGASVAGVTLVLVVVFGAIAATFLMGLTVATAQAGALLAKPAVQRWMDRVAGTVFIGFGLRLALASR